MKLEPELTTEEREWLEKVARGEAGDDNDDETWRRYLPKEDWKL